MSIGFDLNSFERKHILAASSLVDSPSHLLSLAAAGPGLSAPRPKARNTNTNPLLTDFACYPWDRLADNRCLSNDLFTVLVGTRLVSKS
jgi:hypothetical protein